MAKKKNDPLLEQAVLEGSAKYGGEASLLARMLEEQKAQTKSDVQTARGGAAASVQAVGSALPVMAAGYAEAEANQKGAGQFLAAQLAKLGPAGDPYKAGTAFGQKGAVDRLAGEKARALSDLAARKVDAAQGGVFAERQALASGRAEESKLLQRLQDVAGQQGSYVASQYGSLKEKQRDRAVTKHGQELSHQDRVASREQSQANADRQYQRQVMKDKGLDINGKPLPKNTQASKMKMATPQQHAAAKDQIDMARTWIQRLSASGKVPSSQIRQMLELGHTLEVKSKTAKDKDGNPKIIKIQVPKIGKDYVNSAYDLQINGELSPANTKALNRRGLSVVKLGYKRGKPKGKQKPVMYKGRPATGFNSPFVNP